MMNEVRGKVPGKKDWIYGQLLVINDNYQLGLEDSGMVIVPTVSSVQRNFGCDSYEDVILREFYFVDPRTVGRKTDIELDGRTLYEGDILRYKTYDDFEIDAEVKIGQFEQDGSGEEYGPVKVYGVYLEQLGFTRPDWAEETGDTPRHKYDSISPLELMACEDCNLEYIGTRVDLEAEQPVSKGEQ